MHISVWKLLKSIGNKFKYHYFKNTDWTKNYVHTLCAYTMYSYIIFTYVYYFELIYLRTCQYWWRENEYRKQDYHFTDQLSIHVFFQNTSLLDDNSRIFSKYILVGWWDIFGFCPVKGVVKTVLVEEIRFVKTVGQALTVAGYSRDIL